MSLLPFIYNVKPTDSTFSKGHHGTYCSIVSPSSAKSRGMEDKMTLLSTCHRHVLETHSSSWGKILMRIGISILSFPLCLIPRRGRPVKQKTTHEMHPLAYLTGLRGYMAITICTSHIMARTWKWIPDSIIAIPWLQFPFRGSSACRITFFWVSGYVVTYKAIGLMQKRRTGQLLDNLSSLAFRRYLRLMLPVLPVMFVTTMLVSAGIAVMPAKIANDGPNANVRSRPLQYWLKDVGRLMDPFTKIVGFCDGLTGPKLLPHLWTLPVEFRSSMILCVLCIATCKFTSRNRKVLIWLAVPVFVYWQAFWAAMAWIGMWFAECRQERQQREQESQSLLLLEPSTKERPATPNVGDHDSAVKEESIGLKSYGVSNSTGDHKKFRKLALSAVFIYSFVFIQDPYDLEHNMTFPHNVLNNLIPKGWHDQSKLQSHLIIGCMMMLYPLDHVQELQKPLLLPFSQYLGELSFGIYAVHPTLQWTVWDNFYASRVSERCGPYAMDYFWCALPGYVGIMICVLWAAEAFRRMDMQVARLCAWLESRVFEK